MPQIPQHLSWLLMLPSPLYQCSLKAGPPTHQLLLQGPTLKAFVRSLLVKRQQKPLPLNTSHKLPNRASSFSLSQSTTLVVLGASRTPSSLAQIRPQTPSQKKSSTASHPMPSKPTNSSSQLPRTSSTMPPLLQLMQTPSTGPRLPFQETYQ